MSSRRQAVEKVQWYALRWKIEVFHKILKSGCRAEQARLRTAPRLTNLLAVFCILSWRVFWLAMTHRIDPEAGPELVFTDLELRILDRLVTDKPHRPRSNTCSGVIRLSWRDWAVTGAQLGPSTRQRNDLERFNASSRYSTGC